MDVQFIDYMVALRSSGLPGPVRSVALWIASRCAGSWVVTVKTVAADSGFSAATVKRSISALEADGWLVRISGPTGNRYRIMIPDDSKVGSERANGMAQSEPAPLNKLAQREPRIGSERANEMAQSEPAYTRTIQEQTKTNLAPAPTPAPAHACESRIPVAPIVIEVKAWKVARALVDARDPGIDAITQGKGTASLGYLRQLLGSQDGFKRLQPYLVKHQIRI